MMRKHDLAKAASVDAFMADYLDGLIRTRKTDGEAPLHALLFATAVQGAPIGGVLLIPVFAHLTKCDANDKNAFVSYLRAACVELKAIGVVHAMEAWIKTVVGDPEEARRRYRDGDLSHDPERQEAMVVTLDHIAFPRSRVWLSNIERAASVASPAAFQEIDSGAQGYRGRFDDILNREAFS